MAHRAARRLLAAAAGALLVTAGTAVTAPAASGGTQGAPGVVASRTSGASPAGVAAPRTESRSGLYAISVLSSRPDQVTGGDARVRVDLPPGQAGRAVVLLNGRDVTAQLPRTSGRSLEGVVSGLELGENSLEVAPARRGARTAAKARLTLVNSPDSGPVFSGPHQYPFLCTTERNGLGQPLVDNASEGYPVHAVDATGAKTSEVVGYSRDCEARDSVTYMYRSTEGSWKALPAGPAPADLATTTLLDGRTVPYVVRWERGTINRFVYSIAMLAPLGEDPAAPDRSLWNGRLTYSFDGGVAIGHTQGTLSQSNSFQQSLGLGYAVISSSGTRTSVHYNLVLGGETALMVKEEFVERHGVPLYTVGVGGSGGAIQQYVYGQNHPGLIDAAVPQYSYPDMITQTIHVGDCELLERWMDVDRKDDPKWNEPANRQALQGLHATSTPNLSAADRKKWTDVLSATSLFGYRDYRPDLQAGELPVGECRQGWFGLLPLTMNPTFSGLSATDRAQWDLMEPDGVEDTVEWTHFGDLRNVYGVGPDGFARRTWDNVGVQYGLQALEQGVLSPEEFLALNAQVGGWVDTAEMEPEGAPFGPAPSPSTWDPWSSRNMNLSPDGGRTPAPRTTGDRDAIAAAYESGLVFTGRLGIPVIDWRHYREEDLDMHNSHQSFASRQRMIEGQGSADNQLIWFTDARPTRASDQTAEAFRVIDEWMENLRENPRLTVAQAKPADAVDRCFSTSGEEIARGDDVWAGVLDDRPAGACTKAFPLYSTSRIVAGGPIEGGVFACALQPVEEAVARGVYGSWRPTPEQVARLEQIFPTGVCDYTRPDAGRPGA